MYYSEGTRLLFYWVFCWLSMFTGKCTINLFYFYIRKPLQYETYLICGLSTVMFLF